MTGYPWSSGETLLAADLNAAFGAQQPLATAVRSVAGRIGTVTLAVADVSGAAPLASPTLTGTPAAPTASVNTNTTQLATTAFVVGQVGTATPLINGTATVGTSLLYARQDHIHPTDTTRAPTASPTFTGTVTAATTNVGAFTATGITASPISGSTGSFTTLSASSTVSGAGITALLAPYATLASPVLTGTPTAPTATLADNSTKIATTAFVLANAGSAVTAAQIAALNFSSLPTSNPGGGKLWLNGGVLQVGA